MLRIACVVFDRMSSKILVVLTSGLCELIARFERCRSEVRSEVISSMCSPNSAAAGMLLWTVVMKSPSKTKKKNND